MTLGRPAVSGLTIILIAFSSLIALSSSALAAQGVTSAAVVGRVTDDAGGAVPGATLTLTNTSNGQRYQARSWNDGRFVFENVVVGGPYVLEVRALGFRAARAPEFRLTLGQRFAQNAVLERAAVELAGVTVTEAADPRINRARTGAQSFVSESSLARLPTLGRNFTDFITTVPQVVTLSVSGASVGGQNNRFNTIQIDGGVNNDLFGLAASGVPGGQADAHPISVEAVKEYQVLIAPFDVRQGNFAGGLINAVTKSGTNDFHGSAFGYLRNQDLVGRDTAGKKQADFLNEQYGFTLSGPVFRDRAHFFVTFDAQRREEPWAFTQIGSDTAGGKDSVGVGIRLATARRVRDILRSNSAYGFDPGGPEAPTLKNPDRNIFAKVSLQLATNSHFELSQNHVKATDDNLIRDPTRTGFRDGYQLSHSGYDFESVTNTTRAKWTALLFGRFSNELILGYQWIRDQRALPNRVPLIFVGGDRAGTNIAAGADRFSHENSLDQDIVEVTNSLSFQSASHFVTVGTHNEFFKFHNEFFPASLGVWVFPNADSLQNVRPSRYEIALPLRPGGPTSDFNVKQWGFYVQDRWNPTSRLALTAGLRFDVPSLKAPARNDSLVAALGIDTGEFPSGNILWSPRLGFNYDVRGDASTVLRGGVGIFSGRPPYVWISNAYGNTGREQVLLVCSTATSIPAFTIDPDAQPTSCAVGGPPTPPAAAVVHFDPDFKFPQNLKLALGIDHQLLWNIVGTLDFVYTKSINQFYLSDVNLRGIQGFSNGEGGRELYGTINASTGATTPTRRSPRYLDVLRHRNESEDRAFSITTQLQKRFSDRVEFSAGYTYSLVEDLFSLTSSIANSNYRFTTLDGTIERRNLRPSAFDIPHKVIFSGTVTAPFDVHVSLIYTGQSGHPYTYTVSNDANADGQGGNDPVYVPRDSTDITLSIPAQWSTLKAFIENSDCLRAYRGSLLPRSSCRNPWISFLDARVSKTIPTVGGQRIEISADIFNMLNLINDGWGLMRETAAFEQQAMLRLAGYDPVNQRGVYALAFLPEERVQTGASRWKLQLGLKYIF